MPSFNVSVRKHSPSNALTSDPMKVLFVCIGNSCRSPMAESVLKSMASEHGLTDWYVDSAALREWNVGRGPEERALAVLAEHGLTSDHIGRLIGPDDFRQFDYVFGMDESNVADLLHRAPVDGRAKIELLGNYRGKELDRIIIDPYFEHGIHGFRRCFDQIMICCANFIKTHGRTGQ
ncbi:low molecular weight phosphotyrosine protein phosphatase 1 isoform X2 [Anopheles gambiae]|uniref:low molecular weight phosphotyrosine protein phosphatase 1 n=1 Tax=Anopheles coluzzii TaxID=1518534 RepID=UPI0020FF9DB6|nr:low molecular weight phosphotyrosine protein phosphatase 1 [Anopheles coluzzii]XP_320059.5 low molecular weight phosphotyrosine protein phosphatase 1 isoform X2 [Anopheles gambiae]